MSLTNGAGRQQIRPPGRTTAVTALHNHVNVFRAADGDAEAFTAEPAPVVLLQEFRGRTRVVAAVVREGVFKAAVSVPGYVSTLSREQWSRQQAARAATRQVVVEPAEPEPPRAI